MPDPPSPPTSSTATGGIAAERLLAGRYRLVSRLARGGMAEVWEAMDEVLTRPVAVKVLHPHLTADDGFVTRFKREAVAAARLSHPNIVSIYDTCSDGDTEAIVMELVRGRTLRTILDELGPLPHRQAADIAAQVADALDCAHRSGLVHRDVKPGNILISEDRRVLVADFGIAKAVLEDAADLTATGSVVGTAKYLAPEQVTGGKVDARTDVYALGVVLYELLTGHAPFEAEGQLATAVLRLNADPLLPRQRRAGIPRPLEDIVLRAMARSPDDRFSSAAELRAALLGVDVPPFDDDRTGVFDDRRHGMGATTVRSSDDTGEQATPSFRQTERSWLVPTAVILVVAAALGVIGVLVGRTPIGRSLLEGAREAVTSDGGAGTPDETPPGITGVAAFDPPPGDGKERDDELENVLDADLGTTWRTERYNSRADFQGLKDGVGLVLTLDRAARLGTLVVTSPSTDWSAEVYVANEARPSLDDWGDPVARRGGITAGEARFDLAGAQGRVVLLWITDIGAGRAAEISRVALEP